MCARLFFKALKLRVRITLPFFLAVCPLGGPTESRRFCIPTGSGHINAWGIFHVIKVGAVKFRRVRVIYGLHVQIRLSTYECPIGENFA